VTDQLPWLARLLSGEGLRVVGAGILVDARHVVTCAHVVNQALGRPLAEPTPPDRPVTLDLVEAEAGIAVPARSVFWAPIEDERGDVCVLELDSDAPAGTRPAPLRRPARLRGHRFDTYGFPRGFDSGIGSEGEIGRPAGPGGEWVQLEATRTTGHRIEPGFSGAPVWDDSVGGVVGMVVTDDRDPQAKVAFMLPIRELAKRWPPLDALVRACQLYGGGDHELTTHWSPRARGLERDFERGWYFTGRGQVLAELAGWLATSVADAQVRVITGDPGSGKSAVLARLVTLTDPRYRPRVPGLDPQDPAVPAVGVIDVAVVARRKTIGQVVAELARAAEVEADSADLLIEQLGARGRPFRIVVDALDEASEPLELAGGLLRRLASDLAGIGAKVLVGTRRGRRDALLRALGAGAVIYPLDQPPWLARDDLATYVERRLLLADDPAAPTPYRGQEQLAGEVAEAVAIRAHPLFLVAQLTSKGLIQRGAVIDPAAPDWQARFPSTVADSLDWYLTERFSRDKTKVVELLTPLAYAEGEGLPRELWAAAASALADKLYRPDDVQWLLDTAADYLIEQAQADGGPVYRLYHEALTDTLRRPEDTQVNQRILMEALIRSLPTGTDGEPLWSHAHAYVRSHLAVHAAYAGQLDELLADPRFILYADLDRLLGVLRHAATPAGRTAVGTVKRASHHLRTGPLEERAAYLQLVARQDGNKALAELLDESGLRLAWRTPWASWRVQAPHRVLGQDRGLLLTGVVVATSADGPPIAITTGNDGTIRLWDLETGTPRTDNLPAHDSGVRVLAVTTLPDGHPIIITTGQDSAGGGTIRLWDLQTGSPRTDNLPAHDGWVAHLAVATLPNGQPIAVTAGYDGTIRLWDLPTGTPRTDNLPAHQPRERSAMFGGVAQLAIATLSDDHPIAITGGYNDGTIRLWDLPTGTPRTDNLPAHDGRVTHLAVATLPDGQPIAITASVDDGTIRLWDPRTGTPRTDNLPAHARGHGGPRHLEVTTLPDGRLIAITAGYDGTIRLWDLAAGTSRTGNLSAHEPDGPLGGVRHLAVTALADGQPIAVTAGYDDTIRLWNLQTGTPRTDNLRTHEGSMQQLAVTTLPDGHPIAITASSDGTIRLWDLEEAIEAADHFPAHQPGDPFGGVGRLAVATLPDGQPIAITASGDGTIRLWDPRTGTPRTDNLPAHDGGVVELATTTLPDGRAIAITAGTVGNDGTIRLWDLATGAPRTNNLPGHKRAVQQLAVATLPDGQPIAISASYDGTIRLWDLAAGAPRTDNLPAHQPHGPYGGGVAQLAVATLPDGQPIAITAGGDDGTIRLWDLPTGSPRTDNLPAHDGRVAHLAIATLPNGQPIAVTAGGVDGTIRLWDPRTGTPRTDNLPAHDGGVEQLATTTLPDGQAIAITAGGKTIRLWDLTAGAPRTDNILAHAGRVVAQLAIATRPDGHPTAITTGNDDLLCFHDLSAGAVWRQISLGSLVRAVASLPDGLIIVRAQMGLLGLRNVLSEAK
jgi:WD40 repeat protein